MKTSVQIIFTKILNFFGLAKASELHKANNTVNMSFSVYPILNNQAIILIIVPG